jgi:hypothetical protein
MTTTLPYCRISSQFEVVSSVIPGCWVVSLDPGRYLSLAPLAWAAAGFWERYFDGDGQASRIFRDMVAAITAEDP